MNRLTSGITWILGLIGLVVLGWGYLLNVPVPGSLEVVTSRSSSGVVDGKVLLPGDEVLTGQDVRVESSPLTLRYVRSGNRLGRMRIFESSRFGHRGQPLGPGSVMLSLVRGKGMLTLDDSVKIILGINGETYLVRRGFFRWSIGRRGVDLAIGKSARVYVIEDGETIPVRNADPEVNLTVEETPPDIRWSSNPHPFDDYEHHGTLRPGGRVLKSLLSRARLRGVPESPLEAFGHWVRDRWGNVYLYSTHDGTISLRSPGPDQGLFTDDDRIWSETVSR